MVTGGARDGGARARWEDRWTLKVNTSQHNPAQTDKLPRVWEERRGEERRVSLSKSRMGATYRAGFENIAVGYGIAIEARTLNGWWPVVHVVAVVM